MGKYIVTISFEDGRTMKQEVQSLAIGWKMLDSFTIGDNGVTAISLEEAKPPTTSLGHPQGEKK